MLQLIRFEILFASLAAGGDSSEVLAHATDIELVSSRTKMEGLSRGSDQVS